MTTLADMPTQTDGTVEWPPEVCAAILAARANEAASEREVDALAKALKEARDRHKENSDTLGRLIDEARNPPPLFNQQHEYKGVDIGGGLRADISSNFPIPASAIAAVGKGQPDTDDSARQKERKTRKKKATPPEPSDDGQDAAAANGKATAPVAEPKVIDAAEIGLSEGDIRAAYYPNLQAQIENKDYGRVTDNWLVVGGNPHLATVGQLPDADYTLLPVYEPEETFEPDGSPFTGKAVGVDEPHWILGPAVGQVHVRVGKGVGRKTA